MSNISQKNCTSVTFLTFDMNGQGESESGTLLPLPASASMKICRFHRFRFQIPVGICKRFDTKALISWCALIGIKGISRKNSCSARIGKKLFSFAWTLFVFSCIKIWNQIKSFIIAYSLYYAEVCNEFTGPISASLRQGNTTPFKEMSHGGKLLATLCMIWAARDLNPRPLAPRRTRNRLTNWPVHSLMCVKISKKAGFKTNFRYFRHSHLIIKSATGKQLLTCKRDRFNL